MQHTKTCANEIKHDHSPVVYLYVVLDPSYDKSYIVQILQELCIYYYCSSTAIIGENIVISEIHVYTFCISIPKLNLSLSGHCHHHGKRVLKRYTQEGMFV